MEEALEMVINYLFYNIKMPNVITLGNMIVTFAIELNRTVTNNPEIKSLVLSIPYQKLLTSFI